MVKDLTFKKLFLIDALGAVITALMLGLVLTRLERFIGMPENILLGLAGIAALFAAYSFTCYCIVHSNQRPYLQAIAIANTTYCVVTLGLIVCAKTTITWLGIAYFVGEMIVILGLVKLELDFLSKERKSK